MEYTVDLLKQHSIDDIAITMAYLPETIENYFGEGYKWDVNLSYYTEDVPLGTAGSVKKYRRFYK